MEIALIRIATATVTAVIVGGATYVVLTIIEILQKNEGIEKGEFRGRGPARPDTGGAGAPDRPDE